MRHPKRLSSLCLFLLCVLLPGCGREEAPAPDPPTVNFQQVFPVSVTLTKELPGRTSAFIVSEVRPQVNGIIQERLFTEGADVEARQVLYQIDPALYQAAHSRAQAALKEAEANVVATRLMAERVARLVKTNAISQQEHDNALAAYLQAEARVAAARAELETAAINLEYTKVTTPVSGRIGTSAVTPGALVTQNQTTPLARVQQLDPMYVDLTQSSADLLRLREAMRTGRLRLSEGALQVSLILENGRPYVRSIGGRDEPVIGRLEFADITVVESTGVVRLRALFPNPDAILLPGMYVRAVLEEGVSEQAILVPQRAVFRDNRGQPTAWVLRDRNTDDLYDVELRALTVDRALGNQWLVIGGLEPGDLLVVEGVINVRSGRPVRAVEMPVEPATGED